MWGRRHVPPPVRLPGSAPSLLQFDTKQKQTHRLRKQTYAYQRGKVVVVIVQLLSCVWLFVTPWAAASQASLSFIRSRSLLRLMSVESVMPYSHLILCCPLLLLPSVFSSESVLLIRWPNYWSFSFSINPSNEYSELISFRMDWLDLLTVQETLKSLLQHHNSKAPILWCSAFFIVQLSRQEYWSDLPFPSPVDHILSELSTMTYSSWVAVHGMAHSFIELYRAVVHVISLVSFLWLPLFREEGISLLESCQWPSREQLVCLNI